MNLTSISFNIWDDYKDGDWTYCYVEEYEEEGNITDKEKLDATIIILNYIKDKFPDIFAKLDDCSPYSIDLEDLSHQRRLELLKALQESGLTYQGIPYKFYSES